VLERELHANSPCLLTIAIFTGSTSIFDCVGVAARMPKMHLADHVYNEKGGLDDSDHVEEVRQA